MLDTIERSRAKSVTIVGDAFAKPMLRALDAEPDRWDLSSLRVVLSSGVMWSKEAKDGFRRHVPDVILVDSLGSSEALGVGVGHHARRRRRGHRRRSPSGRRRG